MAPVRRLSAHYVLTPEGLRRDIIVSVASDGTILGLQYSDNPDGIHGVEFYSGILVPGLVNAHCHLELSHMKGAIAPGCGFAGFGRGMGAFRNNCPVENQMESASYHDAKMWSEGVSAVGDICNSDNTVGIKAGSRIDYHDFVEVYGLKLDSTQRFDGLLRLMKERGLKASLTPHSMYSLNEGLLRETVAGDTGILSVHFMESPGEAELFRGEGEMKRWYTESGFVEDFTSRYGSPAERLVKNISADRKILLVHNTFVTDGDVELINGHFGMNVTWVLCPRSNEYITGSLPPWRMLTEKGCRIAVGTDSLASNNDLSVLEELKTFDAPLGTLLDWATIEGARALGMEDRLGSFDIGKKPGVVLVGNVNLAEMKLTDESTSRRLL